MFISRRNNDWVKQGVYLELVLWEDFLDAMSQTRLQNEYNQRIRQCDLFVMLFFTKVGKYTAEEFETAFGQFKATNKPFIFTYFKDADISTGSLNLDDLISLKSFQKKLDDLEHFYTRYKNIDELKLHFSQQLDKLAANGFIELKPNDDKKSAKPPSPHYKALLKGSGAIAQGPGAVAAGERGVAIGGNVTGNINTCTQINTKGGAYFGGNAQAGRDLVGGDKIVNGDEIRGDSYRFNVDRGSAVKINEGVKNSELNADTINIYVGEQHLTQQTDNQPGDIHNSAGQADTLLEAIRLDVASPSKVMVNVEFDVAVAIRQPSSPPLAIADLDKNLSSKGVVQRTSMDQIASYRVEIKSTNFAIDPPKLIFRLEYGHDSEVKWFKLVAKKSGHLSVIVIAYQVDGDIEIASTRVVLDSSVEAA